MGPALCAQRGGLQPATFIGHHGACVTPALPGVNHAEGPWAVSELMRVTQPGVRGLEDSCAGQVHETTGQGRLLESTSKQEGGRASHKDAPSQGPLWGQVKGTHSGLSQSCPWKALSEHECEGVKTDTREGPQKGWRARARGQQGGQWPCTWLTCVCSLTPHRVP